MFRATFLSALLLLGLQAVRAQLLTPPGPPASALSPTPDGRAHGVPASALSPRPLPPGVHIQGPVAFGSTLQGPLRRFDPQHRRHVFVPVPLFYPVYGGYDYGDPSPADPNTTQVDDSSQQPADDASSDTASNEDALRRAYLQGARDAMRHDLEAASKPPAPDAKPDPKPGADDPQANAKPKDDDSPPAVFIFKDGHQLETKNFAIMGKTLFDLSGPVLKKVQLDDLDTAATLKANDDRGVEVKLP